MTNSHNSIEIDYIQLASNKEITNKVNSLTVTLFLHSKIPKTSNKISIILEKKHS
jgi:hypothetical protein